MIESRVLMCRTHPVAAFSADSKTGLAVTGLEVLDQGRLPPEFTDHGKSALYAARINSWWKHRAVPTTRDGLERALSKMGLDSPSQLLTNSYGLSLSDQYWVRPESSGLRWSDVNFYTNAFDESLGKALFSPSPSTSGSSDSPSSSRSPDCLGPILFDVNSPDATTAGDLPKRWLINADGTRVLMKAGRSGQEPANEQIATLLCCRLGIEHVKYRVEKRGGTRVSLCPEMLTNSEELVSAWQCLGRVKTINSLSSKQQWITAAQALGADPDSIRKATDEWILVDYLMRNTDRHYNNFALIRDVDSLIVRPAPIFDTGESLWNGMSMTKNTAVSGAPDFMALPFFRTDLTRPTALRQLRTIDSWDAFDLSQLSDWPDEVTTQLRDHTELPESTMKWIHEALLIRVNQVRHEREQSVRKTGHHGR
ncbi:MAG: hypothetical protein LKJ44_04205 [Bifidobacteriaceae bacterium]|jgi:hypothetical protein|nr:hypothetical protein [Bifidobacteriaceae bacterium]MCI1978900.1 hypothetical protein [Bifidobacteriaceae bacterium]